MVLDAALGDVVQEHRDVEDFAVTGPDFVDQLVGERHLLVAATLDFGQYADAAQQVLVHRIVVVHVELHHRHDLAEGAHELAEHAGFVHPPQHLFRVVLRGEDIQEQRVGFLIGAQLGVDQLERTGDGAHGVGVDARLYFCARWKMRIKLTGLRLNTLALASRMRLLSTMKSSVPASSRAPHRPESRHHAA